MIVIIELEDVLPDGANEAAGRCFAAFGVTATLTFSSAPDGDESPWRRYYAVLSTPVPVDDCKALTINDERTAFLHGTDCDMVRLIEADMRDGTQSPFRYCARRLAGGSFQTVDVSAITRKGRR